MFDAIVWLLAVEFLGLLAFPLTFSLFTRLPDRGYSLVKPVALVLASYALWVLGLTHLIESSRLTVVFILLLGVAVSGMVLWKRLGQILAFVRAEGRTLIFVEGLFLGVFFLWLGIVSFVPDIRHTEKPMDFAFLNALAQSRYFPPEDPWLAGHSISYYYFGHLMMAMLTKLTAVPSNISYNLAVAVLPALVGAGAFGLSYNLVRLSGASRGAAIGFGLLAPVLVMVVGNLEGALEFVHVRGWGGDGFWEWVGIKGLQGGADPGSGVFPDQHWWWWRATRVIDTLAGGRSLDYTITEFPFFSFVLGDLHAHVLSLPFLLLVLSVALNLFRSPESLGVAWLLRRPWESAAIMLFLGSLGFINTWDFPVFAAILGTVVLAKSYGDHWGDAWEALKATLSFSLPVILGAALLFLPFYVTLSSQASGILPLRDINTRPFLFVVVMGLFSFLGLSLLLRQLPGLVRPTRTDGSTIALVLIVALFPFAIWAAMEVVLRTWEEGIIPAGLEVGGRFRLLLPGLAVIALAWWSVAQRMRRPATRSPGSLRPLQAASDDEVVSTRGGVGSGILVFPLLLLAAACYMLVGVELFYLTDFFGNRMNTVFKVYYQSWLLLAIVGAYGVYYWQAAGAPRRRVLRMAHYGWVMLVAMLVLASLYYPVGAVIDRTGIFRHGQSGKNYTLDGLAFLKKEDPGEYAAIEWLRDRAPEGRIVEAVGDDYSDYGRISASTGRATLLGWKGHEHQWRGTRRVFDGREADVSLIYESGDATTVRQLLQRYDVRFVYAGRRERATYGDGHLNKFGGFLKTIYKHEGVIIYERE